MFTASSSPFKFASYKKDLVSPKSRATLLTSFSCSHYPPVTMLGALFGEELVVCEKNQNGMLVTGDVEIPSEDRDMTLENFVENFKKSDGLDFVVISVPTVFLITRQRDRRVKVFLTTTRNYVEVFTDPNKFFGGHRETERYYGCYFDIDILKETKRHTSGAHEAVIELEEPISGEEFSKIVLEEKLRTIRVGRLNGDVIEFDDFPLKPTTSKELQKIAAAFCKSECTHIEILGSTKIAGVRREKEVVWFSELQGAPGEEFLYIKEINWILKPFMEGEEEELPEDN